ncbi:PAS domain S-box-containing protein [Trichlorobacter thiogenes]|uniref:PAS domain S-box-containing protein n=1 Tax=Trichlorobacter thiogenes TaxID=115783 RepID=A0A1T4NNB8_9BACT|nr:sigma 54-interacting transcriptional regulator [Trichlorobacter thiogenes]SJZ80703.1 PAS domain S-box-containing protein [Trichlorobacter thiogenes]
MKTDNDKRFVPTSDELRHNAEERLRQTTGNVDSSGPQEDPLRTLHQLQVHQIELEMQNEELLRAQDELERSRTIFSELYDFAPVGYVTLDRHGLIQEANLTAARMLGTDRQMLINKPFITFAADPTDRDLFSRHLTQALQHRDVQRCEIRLLRQDIATIFYGQLQSISVGAPKGKNSSILCSIADGTATKELSDQLQKAHDSLEQLVSERTRELTSANLQLKQEIEERKKAKESLQVAYAEIKTLKDRLQAENIYLKQEASAEHSFGEIIGQSKALSQVFLQVEQVAPMNATVLLLGETGTGKGVIARAIHNRSSRKDRPMITVNCTAIPANLFESELFGREKGAFTGAHLRQMGRFELADGGTIFLDEIGEMPLELQCKLLRVIQDGEFERLGSPRTTTVDVRIIAASNRNLEEEIKNGRFREDLFYRLNVFPIMIPPLRQRKEDMPLLVNHFVAKFNKKIGKKIETISKETLHALQEYHWPGNIRELESVIERATITSQGTTLQVLDRFDTFRKPTSESGDIEVKALADLEQEHILQVLQQTGWRIEGKNGAAVLLGLNPSTLRARIRKHGIHR